MKISAYFFGGPGSDLDKACCAIFESHRGKSVGSGNMLTGIAAGERDVEYNVPKQNVEACKDALKRAGFRLEETPGKWEDMGHGIPDEAPVMH
jgi:hypothetical protein